MATLDVGKLSHLPSPIKPRHCRRTQSINLRPRIAPLRKAYSITSSARADTAGLVARLRTFAAFWAAASALKHADHSARKAQPLRHHFDHVGEQGLTQRPVVGFDVIVGVGTELVQHP